MRLKRVVWAVVAMGVAVALTLGLVSGTFSRTAAAGLYATGLLSSNGPSTLPPDALPGADPGATAEPPSASPTISPSAARPDLPPAVLAAATPRKARAAAVRKRVSGVRVKGMGAGYSGAVLDVGTGQTLFAHRAGQAYTPASTMKLLTTTAALSVWGPGHTFTTSVVSTRPGRITLVGGGDPYLTTKPSNDPQSPASLTRLARSTASALAKQRIRKVRLAYDDSLFSGPSWNKTWPGSYRDVVSPITALRADEGRVNGVRVADPSRSAAEAYAKALRKRGIKVTGVRAERAPKSAPVLARVHSASLDQITEQLLMVSDNDAAEVVLRQAAVGTKRPGSFTGGIAAVRSRLTKLGVWESGTDIHDGSGLSRETKVPASTMVQVLRAAAGNKHPELRGVITGLPVAGVEGSLRNKFYDDASEAGRGLVRGKTGTLTKVHALAGFVRARDGSMMVYAFLVNKPKNEFASVVWLQHVTSALAECGCR